MIDTAPTARRPAARTLWILGLLLAVLSSPAVADLGAEIEAALPGFVGEIMQTPPLFSAIKVAGERAYDLARRGESPELAARPITIASLKLIGAPDPDHGEFEMICGKGGYVRSMARDLGAALGTCAHVAGLRRVASGGFSLDGAMGYGALEALRDDPRRDDRLAPVAAGLSGLPAVEVAARAAERLWRGDLAAVPAFAAPAFLAMAGQAPVAILGRDASGPKILRVFSPALLRDSAV